MPDQIFRLLKEYGQDSLNNHKERNYFLLKTRGLVEA